MWAFSRNVYVRGQNNGSRAETVSLLNTMSQKATYADEAWLFEVIYVVEDINEPSHRYIGYTRFNKGGRNGVKYARVQGNSGNYALWFSSYDNARAAGKLCMELLLLGIVLAMIVHESDKLFICRRLRLLWRYFTAFNLLVWVISVYTITYLIHRWYAATVVAKSNREAFAFGREVPPDELEELSATMYAESVFTYLLSMSVLAYCVLPFQFSYCNYAVDIMSKTFKYAWNVFRDLFIVLFYIMLAFGFVMYMYVGTSGINGDFQTISSGLNVVMQMTFGFYQFGDFLDSEGTKTGTQELKEMNVMIFWLAVSLLFIMSQNIILAIVTDAYASAKREVQAKLSDRIAFYLQLCYLFAYRIESLYWFLRRASTHDRLSWFVNRGAADCAEACATCKKNKPGYMRILRSRTNAHKQRSSSGKVKSTTHEEKDEQDGASKSSYVAYAARMALAEVPEASSMATFVSDPVLNRTLYEGSVWSNSVGDFHPSTAHHASTEYLDSLFNEIESCNEFRGVRFCGYFWQRHPWFPQSLELSKFLDMLELIYPAEQAQCSLCSRLLHGGPPIPASPSASLGGAAAAVPPLRQPPPKLDGQHSGVV